MEIVYKGMEKNKRNEDIKIFEVFKRWIENLEEDEKIATEEKIGESEKPSSITR